MKIEANIEKKHVFTILGAILVLTGVVFVFAQTTGTNPNPGHTVDEIDLGSVELGKWPAVPVEDFAYFGHEDLDHSVTANFALLQKGNDGFGFDGRTILNSPETVRLRTDNVDRLILTDNGLEFPNGNNVGLIVGGGSQIINTNIACSTSDIEVWGDAFCDTVVFSNKFRCPTGSARRTTGKIGETATSGVPSTREYYVCIQN